MARTARGLSNNARMRIGIVFSALLAVNVSMAGLAASNGVEVPSYVYFALGLTAIVIYAVKDQMGVRDATTAAVAKAADPTYPTYREAKPKDRE
jgi:hypothetical protein